LFKSNDHQSINDDGTDKAGKTFLANPVILNEVKDLAENKKILRKLRMTRLGENNKFRE